MTSNDAFTLLEMLVVLFIVTVITFVTLNSGNGFSDNYAINNAINTFGSDYNTMQTYAIRHSVDCYIDLKETSYSIYYDNKFQETIYFSDVVMENNFSDNKVKVNEYGNITQAGTIIFNDTKKLVFTIGQGRYEEQ